MWIRKNKTYVLKTAAEFSNLSRIRDYVLKFAKKSGLTRKQLNDCKLAVDEAVTNVMRHGYSGSEQGDIQIEVIRFEARFEVIIKDWGREFDWASVIDPDLNKYVQIRRKGGLGVWLIKKLTNTVSHHRINNENILTMGFNIDLAARKALIHELWSNIRDRMNISFKFTLFGSLMIFLILGGIYIYIRYNQSGRARVSFISKGKNAALNIANNGVNFILDNQNDIALSELVSNVRKSVDIISYITIINTRNLIIADTDTRRLFTRYNLPKGLKKLKNKKLLIGEYRQIRSVKIGNRKITKINEYINISVPVLFGKTKIGEVHVALNKSQIDKAEGLSNYNTRVFFVTILVGLVGIVGIFFLASIFIQPIRKLSNAMALVGSGERSLAEFGGTVSEFSEIGKAFDEMVGRLRNQESQLTDQTRIKKEMQLAKDIQETLLPSEIPETEGFELAGNYMSALEMGGDYYDFFEVAKDVLGLVVGDVSGKGIGAALIMTMVRTAMRTEARGNKRAADVMVRLNNLIADDIKKGMYITLFYVVLDSKKRTISYASAGHNPMILYRSSEDNTYFLNPKGFAVGLQLSDMNLFKKQIKSENITLAKGDLLFIYTDGITEAMNSDRDQFGEGRLIDFIKHNHHLDPEKFSSEMDLEISRFTGDFPQSDDITYIIIKQKEDVDVELYNRVKRLVDLVENSNMLLEKVLEKTGFTQDEYREVMAKYKKKGLKAFEPKKHHIEHMTLSHATVDQSKKIVRIVRKNPKFGSKRIQMTLNSEEFEFEHLSVNVINKELKKLKLDNKAKRVKFAKRELSDLNIYHE